MKRPLMMILAAFAAVAAYAGEADLVIPEAIHEPGGLLERGSHTSRHDGDIERRGIVAAGSQPRDEGKAVGVDDLGIGGIGHEPNVEKQPWGGCLIAKPPQVGEGGSNAADNRRRHRQSSQDESAPRRVR